jgi:sigma-B regulation protein RsbU (phosphoserine phosphatase)
MTAESGDPSEIVTLWVGRFDPVIGRLKWADGGHPPAILRRRDGGLERLGPTGPLLGAIADVVYEQAEIDFCPGDRILLFTDGVTEARQGNTFYGDERLISALTDDRSVQEDARLLLETVREFVRDELRDDVAILVVAVRAEGIVDDRKE